MSEKVTKSYVETLEKHTSEMREENERLREENGRLREITKDYDDGLMLTYAVRRAREFFEDWF